MDTSVQPPLATEHEVRSLLPMALCHLCDTVALKAFTVSCATRTISASLEAVCVHLRSTTASYVLTVQGIDTIWTVNAEL